MACTLCSCNLGCDTPVCVAQAAATLPSPAPCSKLAPRLAAASPRIPCSKTTADIMGRTSLAHVHQLCSSCVWRSSTCAYGTYSSLSVFSVGFVSLLECSRWLLNQPLIINKSGGGRSNDGGRASGRAGDGGRAAKAAKGRPTAAAASERRRASERAIGRRRTIDVLYSRK